MNFKKLSNILMEKKYSFKNIVIWIGGGIIFFGLLYALKLLIKDDRKKNENCSLIGSFDVDSYELYLAPEMIEGCENHSPSLKVRPLEAIGLMVYMPESYIFSNEGQAELLKKSVWPINKKRSDNDVKINILISYHRRQMTFDEDKKLSLSRSHVVASDVVEFEKYQEDEYTFFYVSENYGYIIRCVDLYGEGGNCKLEYNILEKNGAKGLVKYIFNKKEMNRFALVNNYVHSVVNLMVKEKKNVGQ